LRTATRRRCFAPHHSPDANDRAVGSPLFSRTRSSCCASPAPTTFTLTTSRELKSAFRRLARQLHPDRHPGADGETRARLAAAFHQVREAYLALPL
jgi:hypothetical protein